MEHLKEVQQALHGHKNETNEAELANISSCLLLVPFPTQNDILRRNEAVDVKRE